MLSQRMTLTIVRENEVIQESIRKADCVSPLNNQSGLSYHTNMHGVYSTGFI